MVHGRLDAQMRSSKVDKSAPATNISGRVTVTARKSLISIGRETPVSTGFAIGTAPLVLSARALSTGQLALY